jgi:photosystem II stability/assembly factor-like uncharacterized protein
MTRLRHYDEAIDALETILGLNPPDPGQIRDTIDELRSEQVSETAVTEIPPKPIWRRWWLWAGLVLVATLAFWLSQPNSPLRLSQADLTASATPTRTPIPTAPYKPTATAPPTPTAIPMQWQRLDSVLYLHRDFITSILIDPSDDEVMYASTARAGVYKTINSGITWVPIHNGLDHGWIQNLVMDLQDPDEIYAGALRGGLYRTVNGGESWELLETGITEFQGPSHVAINPKDPDQLAYNTWFDLSLSEDGGDTWELLDRQTWGLNVDESGNGNLRRARWVVFNPWMGELILIAQDGTRSEIPDDDILRILLSANNGASWTSVFEAEQVGGSGVLFVSPYHEEFYFEFDTVTGAYIAISQHDGRVWEAVAHEDFVLPQAASSEGVLYASYPHGIMRFDDLSGTWEHFNAPSEFGFEPRVMVLSDRNPEVMALAGESVLMSTDGGETWVERLNGFPATDIEIVHTDIAHEMLLMERRCDGFNCFAPPFRFFKMNLETGTIELLATEGCGANPESEWEEVYCIYSGPAGDEITYISPADPDYLIRRIGGEVECSTDGGSEFSNHWHSWRHSWISENISSIALHPADPETAFVATTAGLAITRTACGQWKYPEQLEGLNVNSVVINPENPDLVYVGTDAGVFISLDGGYGWGRVNDGLLGALVVYSITIDPINPENVYASTPYGIFMLEAR